MVHGQKQFEYGQQDGHGQNTNVQCNLIDTQKICIFRKLTNTCNLFLLRYILLSNYCLHYLMFHKYVHEFCTKLNHYSSQQMLSGSSTGILIWFDNSKFKFLTHLHTEYKLIFTARKRSLRRLCFYMCLSVHRGGVPGQVPLLGRYPLDRYTPWAGTPLGRYPHPLGRYTQFPTGRYTPRQVHPPGAVHAGRYRQQAGGTHPTGMHSFLFYYCSTKKVDTEGHFVHLQSYVHYKDREKYN